VGDSDASENWYVEEWSRERGIGVVRSAAGARLAFDASVATVADFFVGEEVRIRWSPREKGGARVTVVRPVHDGAGLPTRLEAVVQVQPTGYLALRTRPPAPARDDGHDASPDLEDLAELVFERFGIASLTLGSAPDGERNYGLDGFVFDYGPEVRAFIEEWLGRTVDDLVVVNADYPFSWKGIADVDALFDALASRLPGFSLESATFFGFGARTSAGEPPSPPHLSWSIESTGLLISGVLSRSDWTRWRARFDQLTAHLPMRTDRS